MAAALILAAILLTACRNDAAIRDQAAKTVNAAKAADTAYGSVEYAFATSCERVQRLKRSMLVFVAPPGRATSPLCTTRDNADTVVSHLYALPKAYLVVIQGILDGKPVDYHIDDFFKKVGETKFADKASLEAATTVSARLAALATSRARIHLLANGVHDLAPGMHIVLETLRKDFEPTECTPVDRTYCAVARIDASNIDEQYSRLICSTFAAAIRACDVMKELVSVTGYDPDDANPQHFAEAQHRLEVLLTQQSASPDMRKALDHAAADIAAYLRRLSQRRTGPLNAYEQQQLATDLAVLSRTALAPPHLAFSDYEAARSIFGEWVTDARAQGKELAAAETFYKALTALEQEQDRLYTVVTGAQLPGAPTATSSP